MKALGALSNENARGEIRCRAERFEFSKKTTLRDAPIKTGNRPRRAVLERRTTLRR